MTADDLITRVVPSGTTTLTRADVAALAELLRAERERERELDRLLFGVPVGEERG